MGYQSALNLRNAVTVTRETITSDGMGGTTTSTVVTTLGKAALWQASSADRFLSDRLKAVSSHVLVCRTTDDIVSTDTVTYDGTEYTISGEPDDIMQMGLIQAVPLERV